MGDISGNGREDLIGVWDSGMWVLYSATGKWEKIDKNIPIWLTAGDMTGEYQSDILASYGSGTWYRDSVTTKWYSMAFSAEQLTAGDINGDGWDDMIGVWPSGTVCPIWQHPELAIDYHKQTQLDNHRKNCQCSTVSRLIG